VKVGHPQAPFSSPTAHLSYLLGGLLVLYPSSIGFYTQHRSSGFLAEDCLYITRRMQLHQFVIYSHKDESLPSLFAAF